MDENEIKGLYDEYIIANYGREPIVFVQAENSRLTDSEGREYIDLLCSIGTNLVGHRNPHVVKAIHEQVDRLIHVHNNYYWESQGRLAEKLVSAAGIGGKVFFCNTGTEAVEAALKLARLNSDSSRRTFLAAQNGFHGRTYGALSVTGQDALKTGMGPLVDPVRFVPFNDIDAMEDQLDESVCAVILEPVQGEGGVYPARPDYLAAVRKLCDQHGALLIYDEVQSGMGRTGDWFAYQTLGGVKPDIITSAKALGGGMQIGAVIARDGVHEKLAPGTHGSTFGAHPVSCAAALGVFEAIETGDLLQRGKRIARVIADTLAEWKEKYDFVSTIRQCGLMIGIQLTFPGKSVFQECGRRGLIVNCAKTYTIRLLPALTIPDKDLTKALNILETVLVEESAKQPASGT